MQIVIFVTVLLGIVAVVLQLLATDFFVRFRRLFFGVAAATVFLSLGCVAVLQYYAWVGGGEVTARLLPPYQPITYFVLYVWWRFFAPYLFALCVGVLFGVMAWWYNRRHGAQFFYDEEYVSIALSLFLVGHPLWMFYGALVLALYVLATLCCTIFLGREYRVSFRYFWLPTSLGVIIIGEALSRLPLFVLLKF